MLMNKTKGVIVLATVKCKLCGKVFVDKKGLITHIDKVHNDQIPDDWTAARYENYVRTNKTHGSCVICKEDTEWNESTEKYCRFCGKQSCKDTAREIAEKNLLKTRGVTHSQMLSDPDFQRKMVYSKKTSGVYKFSDSKGSSNIHYDSSYGKDFLEMLDHFMGFHEDDIMGPSPNTYVYEYDGKKHFYIPDFYVPSLHLEVEIKDGGDNPNKHPKIQSVDKVKESLKDKVMEKSKVNYVKISNKEYTTFFKMLYTLKEKDFSNQNKEQSSFSYIVESVNCDNGCLNTEFSIVSWFINQKKSVKTESDKTELIGKLNHMEDFIKHILNNQGDYNKRQRMIKLIDELDWCRYQIEQSIETD